ncbi:Uncharacterised protein [uncultured archaeon]|nr:Uncharacterised protein [uncultured archaeon]
MKKLGIDPKLFAGIKYWLLRLKLEIYTVPDSTNLIRSMKRDFRVSDEELTRFFKSLKAEPAEIRRELFPAVVKAFQIHEVMKARGITAKNAIMVGDNPLIDLAAARLLGIQHASANFDKYSFRPFENTIGAKRRISLGDASKASRKRQLQTTVAKKTGIHRSPQDLGIRWHRQKAIKAFLRR